MRLDSIRPGRPVENCLIETFNGRLRDECVNIHHFHTMDEARERVERRRREYKAKHPHDSLLKRVRSEFVAWLAGSGYQYETAITLRC